MPTAHGELRDVHLGEREAMAAWPDRGDHKAQFRQVLLQQVMSPGPRRGLQGSGRRGRAPGRSELRMSPAGTDSVRRSSKPV
jgi:hypothetical protein